MFKQAKINIEAEGKDYIKGGFTHIIPIFDFEIDLVISKPFANFTSDGCVEHQDGRATALVWLNEICAKDVVIHESVHLAQAVCRTIAPDEDNHTRNELVAYLTEYIAARIFEVIEEKENG